MKKTAFAFARQAAIVALAVASISGAGYVFAAPTAPPPGSSIALPLTRGGNAETKTGALTLQGGLSVSGGSGLCLNGVCKTSWPSSTVQAGTTGVTGSQNFTINPYTYNYTGNSTVYYYQYNYEYNYSTYTQWYDTSFSITAPIPGGGVPLAVIGTPSARCYSGSGPGAYTAAPTTNYYTMSSYYAPATNLGYSFDSSGNLVVTGNCRFYLNSGYYYTNYGIAVLNNATVRYIY